MTTLKAIRRRAYQLLPEIGRVEDVASLTTTTAVVSALATGTVNAEKFTRKWLIRAETATAADRARLSSNFASSTGTLTHAGANYADTTATSEKIEIVEHEPYLLDKAVQTTIPKVKFEDRTIIPCRNSNRVPLHNLSWITQPGHVRRIAWNPSPVLNRDRRIEKWYSVSTAGLQQPSDWTLAGASATVSRSTTQVRRGQYSAALTRVGTDCTLSQTVGLLETGVSADSLASDVLTIVMVCWSSVASRVRVQVLDGTQTVSSSYHTGGSTWEELTTTITVAAAATTLTVRASLETGDTTVYIDDLYISRYAIDDAMRRDNYQDRNEWRPEFDQTSSEAALLVEPKTTGQWVVYSTRGYPAFDTDRILAGSADADSNDVPELTAAVGMIAHLYELVEGSTAPKTREWMREFENMCDQYEYVPSAPGYPGVGFLIESVPWGAR